MTTATVKTTTPDTSKSSIIIIDNNNNNNNSTNNNKNELLVQLDAPPQRIDDDDAKKEKNMSVSNITITNNNNSNNNKSNNNQLIDRMEAFYYDYIIQFRLHCGMIVNNTYVQFFIVCCICINAIMMGIATFDFVQNNDNPNVLQLFELCDKIFLIIFTIELIFQFLFYSIRLFLDGWLIFDCIIIISSWSFQHIQVIRAFRIFRALRLVTRLKVMKNLIIALGSVMPRMFAVGGLLIIINYIFAVMCTEMFQTLYVDGYTEDNYFGSIRATSVTLFQIMTLDNWANLCRDIITKYNWGWIPIISYIIIAAFIMANLIIAIICDAVAMLRDEEKAMLHGENIKTTTNYQTTRNDDDDSDDDDDDDDDDEAEKKIDSNDNNNNDNTYSEMKQQLSILEDRINELTKMQNQTIITLEEFLLAINNRSNNNNN